MSDSQQARKWVERTGAEAVIGDKRQACKLGLSLLRAWRRYKKTGDCLWTDGELYDYTYFLHAFAQRHAGSNDELYFWLTDGGLKILDALQYQDDLKPTRFCRVCGTILTKDNYSADQSLSQVKSWCDKCARDSRLKKIMSGS